MTNFERIKNMNIDEFAKFWDETTDCEECPIHSICECMNCQKNVKEWLNGEEEIK